jgi:hypothetical protein
LAGGSGIGSGNWEPDSDWRFLRDVSGKATSKEFRVAKPPGRGTSSRAEGAEVEVEVEVGVGVEVEVEVELEVEVEVAH